MKKQFLLLAVAVFAGLGSLLAQNTDRAGGANSDARMKFTMEKLAPLNLDAANKAKAETVFSDFYTKQRTSMQEMRAAGNITRDAMKEKHDQLMSERDEKLKAIFTTAQMKKFKDEIEPTMRAQRPVPPPPPAAPGTAPAPPTAVPPTPPAPPQQ